MKKKLFGLVFVVACLIPDLSISTAVAATDANTKVKLSPDVAAFIKGTGMEHSSELPDPEEPLEAIKGYLQLPGSPAELKAFQALVSKYPQSRHAHVGLASAYYQDFTKTKDVENANLALSEEMKAAKIAYSHGNVQYVPWITQMAEDAGQPDVAEQWFDQVLKQDPNNFIVNLYYANLMRDQKNPRAEQLYKKAQDVRPTGNIDAYVAYAEYLLDQGRFEDAVKNTILVGERAFYLDFLHGVALEKVGRGQEALVYYQKYTELSKSKPAPLRYKIQDSPYQKDLVTFATQSMQPETANSVLSNLSFVTACEALAEPTGAMREVAWSVRQRVNRGSVSVNGSTCLYVDNSGSDLQTQYAHVICQGAPSGTGVGVQFSSVICSGYNVTKCNNVNAPSSTTDQVAFDVEYGNVPDPFTNFCPSPSSTYSGTNSCTATCTGGSSNLTYWTSRTPHSFISNTYQPSAPYACMKSAGNICGNGGYDNYFFYND